MQDYMKNRYCLVLNVKQLYVPEVSFLLYFEVR